MKTIYRNLLSVIRRFKMATLLNVAGLSVAFAAFMVIMMQVDYDRMFDKCHPDHAEIFRMEFINKEGRQANISRPLAESLFASSPHIVAGGLANANPLLGQIFFTVEVNGDKRSYKEKIMPVTPGYMDVFTFDFVEGTKEALKNPGHAVIPLSLSRKLFGDGSSVGKLLLGRDRTLTVGAVYRDFPANTSVGNIIYRAIPEDENKNKWGDFHYYVYIRIDDAANISLISENFKKNFERTPETADHGITLNNPDNDIHFTPLIDLHYIAGVAYDIIPKAGRETLPVLFAIAIVILVIAGINFTNFSTALTPMRIKSINTQKVMGAEVSMIRWSLIGEAVLISLFAYILALLWVDLFAHSPLSVLVDAELSFMAHPLITGSTALIAVATGTLAGLYPAFYMTSFPPVLALKGSFGLSSQGRRLRNTLMGFQFMASFALIIGAGFMYLQNHYMKHAALGYEKDELIVTNISDKIQKSTDAFAARMREFSGIEAVTYSMMLLSSADQYGDLGRGYKGKNVTYQVIPVDYSFLDVMGIPVSEGRNFRIEDTHTEYGVYIFNETARDRFELEVGTTISRSEIVGIMPDIKFASFRTEVVPMAFYLTGIRKWADSHQYAYVKVKGGSDMRAAMEHVRTVLAEFDPDYQFEARFFDEVLQQLYEKENALGMLITLFSMIAIFISIVGVFGLVVFDSEYRKKEIG
ncbi:ABC transporter permease, partial [Tannerella forsythia]